MVERVADTESPYIVDDISYRASELNRLESLVPVQTKVGATVLHEAMINGEWMGASVVERQDAIDELDKNDEIRETLVAGLAGFAENEKSLRKFEDESDNRGSYQGSTAAAKSIRDLVGAIEGDSKNSPESPLLKDSILAIKEFNDSRLGSLMRGPIYYTPRGLRSREQLHWASPRARFRPFISGRVAAFVAADAVATRAGYLPASLDEVPLFLMMPTVMSLMTGIDSRQLNMKDYTWNRATVYKHLRRKMASTPEFANALGALGGMDAMTALVGLKRRSEANGHKTVLPTIQDGGVYHFKAKGLKNPLLTLDERRRVVANDVEIGGDEDRLTFLTGPNSGGKSTIAKAIIQNQVLGQIGAFCTADRVELTPADKIAYHVPTPPDLNNETGRFGFELGRVRQILDESTPRSLAVLDDCLDGTTHQERLETLSNVMQAFRYLGGATLFSTHAHELVTQFEEQGQGEFLQVEFDGENPTYRVIPGVSHTSHASRVAELHGFTKEQVQKAVAASGNAEAELF